MRYVSTGGCPRCTAATARNLDRMNRSHGLTTWQIGPIHTDDVAAVQALVDALASARGVPADRPIRVDAP
jgi:hypothetical protein